jgi:hypothetical protein
MVLKSKVVYFKFTRVEEKVVAQEQLGIQLPFLPTMPPKL